MITCLKAFLSGFLSTLVFHQGLIGIFFLLKIISRAPYNFSPVAPLFVPSVISLSFFGGLWGVLIWKLVAKKNGAKQCLASFFYGAIGPTAVAFLVVFPLKGIAVNMGMIPFGFILNGFWGIGLCVLMNVSSPRGK